MKTLTVFLTVAILSSNAVAFDMNQGKPADLSNVKPITIKKSPQQLELEKKYAELKPTMPHKTPYEVCMEALAKLPTRPTTGKDFARSGGGANCNAYDGSPMQKAAEQRKADQKANDELKKNATRVMKPR